VLVSELLIVLKLEKLVEAKGSIFLMSTNQNKNSKKVTASRFLSNSNTA